MPQTREHVTLIKQLGIKHLVVFINKCDAADEEMIELVEMEIRELLDAMGFSEDNTPIVKGSALCALDGTKPELGEKAIEELMDVVDKVKMGARSPVPYPRGPPLGQSLIKITRTRSSSSGRSTAIMGAFGTQ